MSGALTSVLTKIVSSVLVWGLEKLYIWLKTQHAKDKDNSETSELAKKQKEANGKIMDRIEKGEEISDADIQDARRAAHDLIARLGRV